MNRSGDNVTVASAVARSGEGVGTGNGIAGLRFAY